MTKILYLGIDPPDHVVHYPVIATKTVENSSLEKIISFWPQVTHILLTSKRVLLHFQELFSFSLEEKSAIAIGQATAEAAKKYGMKEVLVVEEATQEGMIAFLNTLSFQEPFFLYPHSHLARDLLRRFLEEKQFSHQSFVLYETIFIQPQKKVDLLAFDEIFFTSPSTVDGFLKIFGAFPENGPKLVAIGPITKVYLDQKIKSMPYQNALQSLQNS